MVTVNMPDKIKVGDKFKWTGPDQRTRQVVEQDVWVAYEPDGDKVHVQDVVGYMTIVPVKELKKPNA